MDAASRAVRGTVRPSPRPYTFFPWPQSLTSTHSSIRTPNGPPSR